VRGGLGPQRKFLPLTPTLSPRKSGERGNVGRPRPFTVGEKCSAKFVPAQRQSRRVEEADRLVAFEQVEEDAQGLAARGRELRVLSED
jgi:hypothetical protein